MVLSFVPVAKRNAIAMSALRNGNCYFVKLFCSWKYGYSIPTFRMEWIHWIMEKKKKKNSPLIARILVFHLFYFFADYVANADCDIQLF